MGSKQSVAAATTRQNGVDQHVVDVDVERCEPASISGLQCHLHCDQSLPYPCPAFSNALCPAFPDALCPAFPNALLPSASSFQKGVTRDAQGDLRTDPARWRLRVCEGRNTWHYLDDDDAAAAWPQTIADRHHLNTVRVRAPIRQASRPMPLAYSTPRVCMRDGCRGDAAAGRRPRGRAQDVPLLCQDADRGRPLGVRLRRPALPPSGYVTRCMRTRTTTRAGSNWARAGPA